MDPNLSAIDSIRKDAVSRRGGVRTRGGRLPPIRIGNVPGLVKPSSSKKVFVPNIPQRRVTVKQEIVEPVAQPSKPSKPTKENSRQRGRGRQKVFLQTEGSFLGEGPCLKNKKELKGPLYDRASYASNAPKTKKALVSKIDSYIIDELLKPYDYEEEFHDSTFNPTIFPLVKQEKNLDESKLNIKKEEINPDASFENSKVTIKQEVIETEAEPFIKQEPLDDYEVHNISDKDACIKTDFESKKDLEDFKSFQEEGNLILLQFPSCLPFCIPTELDQSEKKKLETLDEKKQGTLASLKELRAGHIGKLQFMKSGRMRIIIGECLFYLEGLNTKSLWKAASISFEDECKGSITMLGNINSTMFLELSLQK